MENGRLLIMGKAFCNIRGYHPIQFKQASDGTAIKFNAEKNHKEWLITLIPAEDNKSIHVQIQDMAFDRVKEYSLNMEEIKNGNYAN